MSACSLGETRQEPLGAVDGEPPLQAARGLCGGRGGCTQAKAPESPVLKAPLPQGPVGAWGHPSRQGGLPLQRAMSPLRWGAARSEPTAQRGETDSGDLIPGIRRAVEKMEGDPVLEDWQGEVFKLKEVIIESCVRQEEAPGRQAGSGGTFPSHLEADVQGVWMVLEQRN